MIGNASLTGVTLQTTPSNPSIINQIVTLTATPVLGNPATPVEYKFLVGSPATPGVLSDICAYSPSNTCTWQPTAIGSYQLVVWARKVGHVANYDVTASQNVAINGHPPTASDQSVMTPENTPLSILLTGADQDGNHLTFTYTQPQNGSVTSSAENTSGINYSLHATYTPNLNYVGFDLFQFTVTDSQGNSALGTVCIDVTPGAGVTPAPGPQNGETGYCLDWPNGLANGEVYARIMYPTAWTLYAVYYASDNTTIISTTAIVPTATDLSGYPADPGCGWACFDVPDSENAYQLGLFFVEPGYQSSTTTKYWLSQ